MSWVDKAGVITIMILRTEGTDVKSKTFTGLVRAESYSGEIEFNATEYTFINIDGELVKKRKLLKRDFNLEFYFQGADHLDVSEDFRTWTFSESPWVVNHPYYGIITCQVIKLKFDNAELNTTKWSGTAIETIENIPLVSDLPKASDIILLKTNQISALVADNPDINPTFQDVDNLKLLTRTNYNSIIPIIKIPQQAQDYFNAFNTAITAINAISESPILAMNALNSLILLPFQFTATVYERINSIIAQFDRLRATIVGITTKSQKRTYEYQGAGFMSALAATAVTPQPADYKNASSVLTVINKLIAAKAGFYADIDTIRSPNGSNPLFYVPGLDLMRAVDGLINLTISQLYNIALGGRREFSYILPNDSNAILLAHQFYGPSLNDINLREFIANNSFNYRDIALGVQKGRTILYYL